MYEPFDSGRSIEALARAVNHRRLPPRLNRHWAQHPSIAVSRQVGARGTTIARAVGDRLGWQVYDHELLERMAAELHVRVDQLERLDERSGHWLDEIFQSLGGGRHVSETAFCQSMVHTLFSLAQRGQCVLVGRGAAQLLPASTTLRVRLVAALEDRIRVMSRELGVGPEEARRFIERRDRQRERYVRDHFARDSADPLQYDLVLNSSRFDDDECAQMIVQALQCRQTRTAAETADAAAVA